MGLLDSLVNGLRGAYARMLLTAGVPMNELLMAGPWRSTAFRRYADDPLPDRDMT